MTAYADSLRPFVGNANVQAFLRLIREGESSQEDRAYFMRWPGKTFDDLTKHPKIFEPGPNGPSSAAGAYQITWTTYNDFAPRLGVDDFSRQTQDLIAVAIIHSENALLDVYEGRVVEAIQKLGGRWASLPSSTVGQPTVKLARLLEVYRAHGGTISQPAGPFPTAPSVSSGHPPEPAPAAPPSPESAMPLPVAAVAALGVELLKLLPFARKPEHAKAVEVIGPQLVAIAREVSGPATVNEQAAVETVQKNPTVQAAFVAKAVERWSDLAPAWEAEEKSRREAREFGEHLMTTGPEWRQIGAGVLVGVLSLTIIVGGGAMFWSLMSSPQLDPGQKGLILGALLSVFSSTAAYWFGSSASSRIKDTTIADQARR
jgi:muramidase (phage lysozyme)